MWRNIITESEAEPTHYFLMRRCHDGDEWIGIYDNLAQLESAYKASVLEQEHKQCRENSWTTEHEKVMINVFSEATGQWRYDIPYEALFSSSEKNGCPCNECKVVKIWIDHEDMFIFRREMIRQSKKDYICDGTPSRRVIDESISVQFHVKSTYEIFDMLGELWGGWNGCPDYKTMGNKAQEWQEKYGAELIEISHDTLSFRCSRCLSEDEADALWKDIFQIAPNSQDIKENGKKKILESGQFSLWWD